MELFGHALMRGDGQFESTISDLDAQIRDRQSFTVPQVLRALRESLSCRAVILSRNCDESRQTVLATEPASDWSLAGSVLAAPEAETWIHNVLTGRADAEGLYSALNVEIHRDSTSNLTVVPIPLPGLPIPGEPPGATHWLTLLDSAKLSLSPQHGGEFRTRCRLLVRILHRWWIDLALPVARRWRYAENATTRHDGEALDVHQLAFATLSELFGEAMASVRAVRSRPYDDAPMFEGEIATATGKEIGAAQTFDWQSWTPRFPLSGHSERSLQGARAHARTLIYWCRWVNAHRVLEREQASTAFGWPAARPMTGWVHAQRALCSYGKLSPVLAARLDEARQLAALSFCRSHGEPPAGPDVTSGPLSVRRNSLLCFGLSQWLASNDKGSIRGDLGSGMLSDVEFCRELHAVAVISHCLLGDQPHDEELVRRLIQIVSRYAHSELGVPERVDLRGQLLHAARGEPALHALKPFYRDHFFHALEVCCLGHVLLEARLDPDTHLWELVAKYLGPKHGKRDVLRLWYFAALLHDTGYAMDTLQASRRHLGFFDRPAPLRSLQVAFDKAIAGLAEAPEIQSLELKREPGVESNHGVIGALYLRALLADIVGDPPDSQTDAYLPAIDAIARHDLRRPCDRISFQERPLAFLLALCDQVQAWRRPQLAYETAPYVMLAGLSSGTATPGHREGPLEDATINLEARPGETGGISLEYCQQPTQRPKLTLTLTFDDQINHNCALFHEWIDATLNFQRLDFSGLPLDIDVKFVSPFYKNGGAGDGQPQLHRLRDAAHETHMGFLAGWFPNRPGDAPDALSNGAIRYRCDGEAKEEALTIDLRALSQKTLITRDWDAFWKCMREWKHFLDDRDFPGDYANVTPA